MLIEAARRVTRDLSAMIEAVNSGAAATDDIREALAVSKAIGAKFQAFQSAAAAVVAARERHGDGGAAVLTQAAGVSRRQAGAHARTNEMLKSMPAARGAVESGKMSFENARRLVDAAAKTGADAVESDEGLLAQAVALGEDDFARSARRWALRQQSDGGEADYARRRARRYVRFWDAGDGMVHLRGEFDPLTGRRIQHRLEADARRALRIDRQQAAVTGTARTLAQCMADTLEDITLNTAHCAHTHNIASSAGGGGSQHRPRAAKDSSGSKAAPAERPEALRGNGDSEPSGHSDPANIRENTTTSNNLDHAGTADSERLGELNNNLTHTSAAGAQSTNTAMNEDNPALAGDCRCASDAPSAAGGRGANGVGLGGCGPGKSSARAQVAVVAHLDAAQSRLFGELAGGEPLPASVLEELLCNAEAFGVLFSNRGKPLWQGKKKRFADDNLMRALIARDGACVGCGAHYVICEGHHIEPVSQGGRTDIDNMVLACGRCHHRVHHDGWQVVVHADRYSIEPPQRVHYGPARAPEREPLFRRAQLHEEAPETLFADEVIDGDTHRRLLEGARAALRSSRNRQPPDEPATSPPRNLPR